MLHRINTQASTTANAPKSSARSRTKATNRSPSLAKRNRLLGPTEEVALVGAVGGALSVSPHSSKRYWPEGMAPPQRVQSFRCARTWLWQCGHSIVLRRPSPSVRQEYSLLLVALHHQRTTIEWPLSGCEPLQLSFITRNGHDECNGDVSTASAAVPSKEAGMSLR